MQIRKLKKLMAMTLAELLVTMVVLGSVFALSVPVLKVNAERSKMEGLFLKSFSMISDAVDLSLASHEYTDLSKWQYTKEYTLNELAQNLPVVATCTEENYNDCFASSYRNFKKSGTSNLPKYDAILLSNGIAISIYGVRGRSSHISVDLNGPKKPNMWGYDLFVLQLTDGGLKGVTTGNSNLTKSGDIINNNWKINYW